MANCCGLAASLCLLLAACATPAETRDPRIPGPVARDPVLLPPVDEVQTVQLYAQQEKALPIYRMGRGAPLTLEFDLMGQAARPLSIYFSHADQQWERDLSRAEYLESFHRDDLFNYTASNNTQVHYTHYWYSFPNESIGFRLSGNYILRVTEQGQEEEALFERLFYVVEDLGAASLDLQNLLVGGLPQRSVQPLLRFAPPVQLAGSTFDFSVCFIRNGRHRAPRCSPRPSLSMQPDLLFYLEPEEAFRSGEADYTMDLRQLRPGGQVERVSFASSPFEVVLQPDYARFASTSADPLLSGQSVISRAHTAAGDPDTGAEYARVHFSYVPPDETRLHGGVYIAGSFNGWGLDLARQLRWIAQKRRYEGSLLIKQGEHEYRYTSPDPNVRHAMHAPLPRADNYYTAFVYYRDAAYGTDRLVACEHGVSQ